MLLLSPREPLETCNKNQVLFHKEKCPEILSCHPVCLSGGFRQWNLVWNYPWLGLSGSEAESCWEVPSCPRKLLVCCPQS